jgi:hypothetical protein
VSEQAIVQLKDWLGSRRVPARLVNLSASGVLIVTEEKPALNQPLWLRLVAPWKTGWVGAIPVRYGPAQEVGLQLTRRCPEDLFRAATVATGSVQSADSEEDTSISVKTA